MRRPVRVRVKCMKEPCGRETKELDVLMPRYLAVIPVLSMHVHHGNCGLEVWLEDERYYPPHGAE